MVADTAEGNIPTVKFGEELPFEFRFESEDNHALMLEMIDHASAIDTYGSITDTHYFRNQSPGEKMLIGIDALDSRGKNVPKQIPRVWGVVVGGDNTTPPATLWPLTVDLDVYALAPFDRYPDEQAVRSQLEKNTV